VHLHAPRCGVFPANLPDGSAPGCTEMQAVEAGSYARRTRTLQRLGGLVD
jgi:hypothetical protein